MTDYFYIEQNEIIECSDESLIFSYGNSLEEDDGLNFLDNEDNNDDLGKKLTSNKTEENQLQINLKKKKIIRMMKNLILKFLKQIIIKIWIQIPKKKSLLAMPMIK